MAYKGNGKVVRDMKPCEMLKPIYEHESKLKSGRFGTMFLMRDPATTEEFIGGWDNRKDPNLNRIESWSYDTKSLEVFYVEKKSAQLLDEQMAAMAKHGITPIIQMANS